MAGPVTLTTRFGDATTGPVVDSNGMYDMVVTLDAPAALSLELAKSTKPTGNDAKGKVGETVKWDFTWKFGTPKASTTADGSGFWITKGYNLVLKMTNTHATKFWKFATTTTCMNTQFGNTHKTTQPLLTTDGKVACTTKVVKGVTTITVANI